MSLPSGTRLGPYEILEPLGSGGMGDVYRARDTKLGREVAVKVLPQRLALDPAALARFEREAQAVAALSNPHILSIFDFGNQGDVTYAVSELLEGDTLRGRFTEAGGALPTRKALDYAVQFVRGISAAHEKGIVHRDLKPENVFVTRVGQLKILDFGLAKTTPVVTDASATAMSPPVTDAGTVLGTVGYMSPEQVRGRPLDHRTDIFSFGAVLYEMLTGRRAFKGDSHVETMNAILKDDPPEFAEINPALPSSLDRIVRRCLEKNPDERFYSAHDLGIALEALSGPSSQTSAAKDVVLPPSDSAIQRWLPAVAAAAIVGAAMFFGGRASVTTPVVDAPDYHRLTYRRGVIQSARFGPDGQTMVYSAVWEGDRRRIYSTRASSPESSALPFDSSDVASVSSTGELAIISNRRFIRAYAQVGTLARAPITGGAAREVLENVQDADWLPDGSGFAVSHYVDGKFQLEFPAGKSVYTTGGFVTHLRVSADGTRVAFLDHPILGDDRGFVAVVDRAGAVKRLTGEYSSTQGLAWKSADEIWFTGADAGSARSLQAVTLAGVVRTLARVPANLQLGDINPRGEVLLWQENARRGMAGRFAGETVDRDLSWLDWSQPMALSADSKQLLFSEQGDGGGSDYGVYLRPIDGGPAVRLGTGEALDISADGKWVLVQKISPSPTQLVLLPTGAGEPRTVTSDAIEHEGARFMTGDRQVIFYGFEPGRKSRAYIQDLEGGSPRAITPEGVIGAIVSPDGAWLPSRNSNGTVSLYPVGGGAAIPALGVEASDDIVRWAGDGLGFYVRKPIGTTGAVQVFKVDPRTGRRTPVREITSISSALPNGGVGQVRLTPDASGYVYGYGVTLADLYLVTKLR